MIWFALLAGAPVTPGKPIAASITIPPGQPAGLDWSFAASKVHTYIVPDSHNYAQPTFKADRGWLHLEARLQLRSSGNWIPVGRIQLQR